MAKSNNRNRNKAIKKKQAQKLNMLKNATKHKKDQKQKLQDKIYKQNKELEILKNKTEVYENIISELREKILSQEELSPAISEKEPQYKTSEQVNSQNNQDKAYEQIAIELESAKQDIQDWQTKAVRLSADLQNVQKQNELDLQQAKKSAKKNTIISILEFLNTLNISFNYIPKTEDKNVESFINTLKLSYEKVIRELQSLGIEILAVSPGDDFDPSFMNILNTQVTEENSEILHKVTQVVGLGLKIDGQLVQPASVIIQ